jgi:hypothetical protein
MKLLKQALTVLATAVVVAAILVLVTPKTAHSGVATLVQLAPGNVTAQGQGEGALVSLLCESTIVSYGIAGGCESVNSSGVPTNQPYSVPAGDTLIVTDYEWYSQNPQDAGLNACDTFLSSYSLARLLPVSSCALSDKNGNVYGREHFTTGIRIASGEQIYDFQAQNGWFAAIQGYVVPN